MGIVQKIGQKAGDKVAKLSALSPDQIDSIQLEREKFLLEMPDPSDGVARIQTERIMSASSIEIFNAFLPQIKALYAPIKEDAIYTNPFDSEHNIRYFNITKWVSDKKENSLEKLVNVYAVLASERCNIALVFHRTKKNSHVYMAVVDTENSNNNNNSENYKNRLIDAIKGNFPGAELENEGLGILPCFDLDKTYSVASATNIPTEKSEKFVSQTIEKLLDGIVPDSRKKEYILILLATPIMDVEERKMRLGEFYSGMAPYASWQTDYHYNESKAIGSSATIGVNVGASAGIQNGQNYSVMESDSTSEQSSQTKTKNQSDTKTTNTAESHQESQAHADATSQQKTVSNESSNSLGGGGTLTTEGSVSMGGGAFPGSVSASKSASVNVNYNHTWGRTTSEALGKTATDTITRGLTNTISNSIAQTTGTAVANTLGKAVTKAMATSNGAAKSVSFGGNFGANFARSSSITAILGKNEGITQSFVNYNIKHALDILENQMKRMEQSSALGMWDFATYVLCEDYNMANNVACSYLALTQGEDSYMSRSAVNLWRGNLDEDRELSKEISRYLCELRHPVFGLKPSVVEANKDFYAYPPVVTATTALTGKELAYSLNFPQKSIAGLPVLECAEFGRKQYDLWDTRSTKH